MQLYYLCNSILVRSLHSYEAVVRIPSLLGILPMNHQHLGPEFDVFIHT